MKRQSIIIFILFLSINLIPTLARCLPSMEESIRKPIFSGSWYPKQKEALKGKITQFLKNASCPQLNGRILALIVPHAGYMYSGQIAAYAYKLIKGRRYERVIILGPSHRYMFSGVSVNIQKAYRTPLGLVSVDQEFGKKIINSSSEIRWVPLAHRFEHSIEIQLPFLQLALKDFKIIPILFGEQGLNTCKILSKAIFKLLQKDDQKSLLIASSDLSHYHTYSEAKKLDSVFIKNLKNLDPISLDKALKLGQCEACGKGAVLTAILYSRLRGANMVTILKSGNSGDVTGERERVVGYCAVAIWIMD